jgi:uncharacterized protein DUF6370
MALMNKLLAAAIGLMLAIAVAPAIATDDVTLSGTIVCAQCHLHKADAHECQDILLVDQNGTKVEYYVVKNAVAKESGEACTLEIPATVTGEVSEKDGRKWIAPSKIVKK